MSVAELATAVGVLATTRALYQVLDDGASDSVDLRVTVVAAGVYIEVLPGDADELARIAEVDRIALLLGTGAGIVAVAGRHYYQAEAETEGVPVQVSALLAPVDDLGHAAPAGGAR
jgi:hypothetical protein